MSFNIVVPLDGSKGAERAVEWALAFAPRTGSVLSFCSVFDPMLSCVAGGGGAILDPEPMLVALEEDAKSFCAAAVARATGASISATSAVLEGVTIAAIVEFARERAADIIVLGTHGRQGLSLGLFGSITDAIVRTSDVAVVVVRAETELGETGPIVVAIDDSQASSAAAGFALKVAHALDVPVRLVHVARVEDGSRTEFGEIARKAAAAGISCTTEIRYGSVIDELIAVAAEQGACMFATGTHGRGSLERLFLGSVAEGLMRQARLPVIVVRNCVVVGRTVTGELT